ncbi:MAG: PEP-utilizing enzyme, partial [Bdellovibrionota bacterium]
FRFFWPLDHSISQDQLKSYREALAGDTRATNLKKKVSLLQAQTPILPGVYLTSSFRDIGATATPPPEFLRELTKILSRFEQLTHQQFAGRESPLLLTVQSDYAGAIRNIGCCPKSLRSLIHNYGESLAFTIYVDFLESFSTLILGCPPTDFRKTFGIESAREGGPGGLIHLKEEEFSQKVKEYQNVISQKIKRQFPEQPEHQLLATLLHYSRAAKAAGGDEVFMQVQMLRSLDPKAVHGLAYTRNPFTGKKDLYGVYQGGVDPKKYPIEAGEGDLEETRKRSLREKFPEAYQILKKCVPVIEASFCDVVEAEFVTDADGHLYFIGFDKGQTSTKAAIVAAVELNLENKLSDVETAMRIKAKDIEILLHPTLDDDSRAKLQDAGSTGATAAPGTSVGHVFFKMTDAIQFYRAAVKNKTDKRVILIADELLISDTPGLSVINGLITRAAGIASHAAVMARANGIPCIVGLKGLECAPDAASVSINGKSIAAGTLMTLEAGSIGRLYFGEGRLHNLSYQEGIIRDVSLLMNRLMIAEKIPFEVRVNINNAKDAETGLSFGADGVGLCRTENMFMEPESLREIRNVIFSKDPVRCAESFKKLEEIALRHSVMLPS